MLFPQIPQWQGDPDVHDIDDMLYTNQILDTIQSTFCIDNSRIYSSGFSNGGGLTNVLACDAGLSLRFAAFGIISGAIFANPDAEDCDGWTVDVPCNSSRSNLPIMEMHGMLDTLESYDGGPSNLRGVGCRPSIPHWATNWATRNQLSTDNDTALINNDVVTRYTWAQDQLVTTYHVANMTHEWPSSPASAVDATQMLLDWFARWHL